jgi:WD40 repeat protein
MKSSEKYHIIVMETRGSVLLQPSPNWYGGHGSAVHGKELAYCAQNAVVLLDLGHDLRSIDILSGCSSRTACVCYVEKNDEVFLVTAALDRSVLVWKKAVGDSAYTRYRHLTKRPAEIRGMCVDRNGTLILGDKSGNVFSWCVAETGSKMKRLQGCKMVDEVVSIDFCPSSCVNLVALGYKSGSVHVFDYVEENLVFSCDIFDASVHCVAWCSLGKDDDGKMVHLLSSSSKNGSIHVIKVIVEVVTELGSDSTHSTSITHTDIARFENDSVCSSSQKPENRSHLSVNRFWGGLSWVHPSPSCNGVVDVSLDDRACATYLLSSSQNGRILVWKASDIMNGVLQPITKLPESHSRAVFSVRHALLESELCVTAVGLDRMCTSWTVAMTKEREKMHDYDWRSAKISQRCVGLGAHPTSLSLVHGGKDQMVVAVGSGDGNIRLSSCCPLDTHLRDSIGTTFWKGITSSVSSVSWYPGSNTVLAFGCEDGTVGLLDTATKRIHAGMTRHQMPVCALVWLSKDKGFCLQSWCTAGTVLTWPHLDSILESPSNLTSGTRDMAEQASTKLNDIRKISCLAACGGALDGRVVVGRADGAIEVFECQCNGTPQEIATASDPESPFPVLMISAYAGKDLDSIALFEGGCLSALHFCSGKGTVVGRFLLARSFENAIPSSIGVFPTGIGDTFLSLVGFESGLLGVFVHGKKHAIDANMKLVDKLRGHSAPILQCRSFCLNSDFFVVTSSQDQSVRVWHLDMKKYVDAWMTEDNDLSHLVASVDTGHPNEEQKTKQPKTKSKSKDGSMILNVVLPTIVSQSHSEYPSTVIDMIRTIAQNPKDNRDLFEKLQKDIFGSLGNVDVPISDHSNELYLSECAAHMAQSAKTNQGDHLDHRRALSHRAAALKLWAGDVGAALKIVIENDALTSDFVCFAAGAGRDAWVATVRAYADQLERKGEIHIAALYLLQAGDVVDTCLLYERHRMLREAATIAMCRLPESHHVTIRCLSSFAKQLAKQEGNRVKASMIHLFLGNVDDALACIADL